MKPVYVATMVLCAGLLAGCVGKTHCQSGPKHGTQCYDHDGGYKTTDQDAEEPRAEPKKGPTSTTPRWK
jgi:hypothetical protein